MSDMMSPEEIEAMLAAAAAGEMPPEPEAEPAPEAEATPEEPAAPAPAEESTFGPDLLSQMEIDALGEIGNICMGTSATTMYTLLGKRVTITTPRISIYENCNKILEEYSKPFVIAQVDYIEGLKGNNLLLLKEEDAAIITDLLMGGDGKIEGEIELGELQISAMAEVMNQMVGSSATAMADMTGEVVNISTPKCELLRNVTEPLTEYFETDDEPVIRINFNMEIEDVLNSEIMQAMPLAFGKQLVAKLMGGMEEDASVVSATAPQAAPQPEPMAAAPQPDPMIQQPMPQADPAMQQPMQQPMQLDPMMQQPMQQPVQPDPMMTQQSMQQPMQQPYPQQPMQQPYPQQPYPQQAPPQYAPQPSVEVKPVQYQSFDTSAPAPAAGTPENMQLLFDVPLQVTIELGQAKRSIREILEMGTGSVVVLEKLAGDLVEVMVNGKLIARGEVVVIEENYGVRITEIVSQSQRMDLF